MGWFKDITEPQREKAGWEIIPETPEDKAALAKIMELLETELKFEPRGVSPLAAGEVEAISKARKLVTEGVPGLEAPMAALTDIMQAPVDVEGIPGMKGLFDKARELGASLLGKEKRALQLTGNVPSESSRGEMIYGKSLRDIMEGFVTAAYPFVQQHLAAKYSAPRTLADIAMQSEMGPIPLSANLSGMERSVEQSKLDAITEALRMTKTAPFQFNLPIAQSIRAEPKVAWDPGFVTAPSWQGGMQGGGYSTGATTGGGGGAQQMQYQPWGQTQQQPQQYQQYQGYPKQKDPYYYS